MDNERQLREMGHEIETLSLELETLRNEFKVRLFLAIEIRLSERTAQVPPPGADAAHLTRT